MRAIYRGAVLLILLPASAAAQVSMRNPGTGEQTVRAGDVVRLRIWREPDLSGEFAVGEDGTVMLPKIGAVSTGGLTADSMVRQVRGAYAPFLKHDVVEVVVIRRIQVLGAVHRPGLYPVDGTMSLADVLSLAGGADDQGRADRVELIRRGGTRRERLSTGAELSSVALESGDQIFVPERGWLERHSGVMAAAMTAGVGAILGLLSR